VEVITRSASSEAGLSFILCLTWIARWKSKKSYFMYCFKHYACKWDWSRTVCAPTCSLSPPPPQLLGMGKLCCRIICGMSTTSCYIV